MADRVRDLAALAALQRVRVLVAEAALVTARAGEDDARTAETEADAATLAALDAWQDSLTHPEFARARAADLLRRDSDRAAAAERTHLAAGLHERRRADWRLADALADATDDAHAAACRSERRRRDERALAALGDRVGYQWSRR